MDSNQVWNLTEILETISNNLSELKEDFDAQSQLKIEVYNNYILALSNVSALRNLVSNTELRSNLLINTKDILEMSKNSDPNFLKKMEALKEMTNLCKAGIVLAKNEGKEII